MPKRSNAPRFKFCEVCGNRYERIGKQSNHAWDNRKACSKKCGKEYQRTYSLGKSTRFCQQCRVGKLLWYQSRFCSTSCKEIWNDEHEYDALPPVIQEWPEWMEIEKPFAAHDFDPDDGIVTRLNAPNPYRLGISLCGSSSEVTETFGDKGGPWTRTK